MPKKQTKGNKKFRFGKGEVKSSVKVFLWTVASAAIVLLLDLVEVMEVPTQYTFAVPIVNTILYSLKELVTDNSK